MITASFTPNTPFTFAIDWLSCLSPVAADGTVDSHPWSFRGKDSRWEFVVSLDGGNVPIDLLARFDPARGFCLSGTESDLGHQQEPRIRSLIVWAAQQFHEAETAGELAVCCATCPDAANLAEQLVQEGFRLTFQLPGKGAQSQGNIPALPAQYHYHAADETEVLFLAGRDRIEPDLPLHASRFWFVRGTDVVAFRCVIASVTQNTPIVAPHSR